MCKFMHKIQMNSIDYNLITWPHPAAGETGKRSLQTLVMRLAKNSIFIEEKEKGHGVGEWIPIAATTTILFFLLGPSMEQGVGELAAPKRIQLFRNPAIPALGYERTWRGQGKELLTASSCYIYWALMVCRILGEEFHTHYVMLVLVQDFT